MGNIGASMLCDAPMTYLARRWGLDATPNQITEQQESLRRERVDENLRTIRKFIVV